MTGRTVANRPRPRFRWPAELGKPAGNESTNSPHTMGKPRSGQKTLGRLTSGEVEH
jgi:hypothetical protein